MNVDFHLHTSASDGAHEPARIAQAAAEARLVRWAITDHDSVAGWRAVAGAPGLVPGVEVTGQTDDREIHVVGLGVDPDDAAFAAFLAGIRATREQRM
nr:phosphatase [Planctomycetota bacterium]